MSDVLNDALNPQYRERPDPYGATWVLMFTAFCLALVPSLGRLWGTESPPAVSGCIDPNTAPCWELTALPRIGMATAFEIVRYRESVASDVPGQRGDAVFTRVADLAQVRGIGPVTLQLIGRYLCLPGGTGSCSPTESFLKP